LKDTVPLVKGGFIEQRAAPAARGRSAGGETPSNLRRWIDLAFLVEGTPDQGVLS